MEPGQRVVVRYLLPDGQPTDALGLLVSADETHLVVATKRGDTSIVRARIIAAKEVPPAPTPRPR